MKFAFPVLWIGLFGYGTLRLWIIPYDAIARSSAGAGGRVLFLLMLGLGSVLFAWTCFPLKRVIVTSTGFRVSNYFTEISVPFQMVERITQNRWINVRPITLHLRRPSEFGDRITFLPAQTNPLIFWREDELVAELRQATSVMSADQP